MPTTPTPLIGISSEALLESPEAPWKNHMPPVEKHQSGRGRDREKKEGIGLVETHIEGWWRHRLDRPIKRYWMKPQGLSAENEECQCLEVRSWEAWPEGLEEKQGWEGANWEVCVTKAAGKTIGQGSGWAPWEPQESLMRAAQLSEGAVMVWAEIMQDRRGQRTLAWGAQHFHGCSDGCSGLSVLLCHRLNPKDRGHWYSSRVQVE